jgi:hypothetical protein
MATDRTAVENARKAFTTARLARLQAQADLATKTATAASLARTLSATSPQLQAAQAAVTQQQQVVTTARATETAAIASVTSALTAFLGASPADDVARLEATAPIVLLPVRIETRFAAAATTTTTKTATTTVTGATTSVQRERVSAPTAQLLVRMYPDEIAADSHEPQLSAAEQAAGDAYWTAATAAGGVEQLSAWQTLLQTYSSQRAAWIVRVRDPKAATPATFNKPSGWSRAVEARLQPDRYVVVATRGTTSKQAFGAPVVEPLALSVGPDTLASDQASISPDGTLVLDDAVKWTVDFDTAVANGMAIRLPIDAEDATLGFDRVVVLGVKTSLDAATTSTALGALFDAQHYTGGLAFVKQGTPTSNAAGTPAGFPPADPNGQSSFAIERGAALDTVANSAALMATQLLGLPAGVFTHVDGGELVELTAAQKMNRVLYSATFGYYLDQIMSPLVGAAAVNEVGQIFATWVVPRGPVSAFRVGNVPYGILPVTSLARWQDDTSATAVQRRLSQLLAKLRPLWLQSIAQAPHVGRSSDPDQDLLDVLAMDASAREVRVRRVVGEEAYLNLLSLLSFSSAGWESAHATVGEAALQAAGVPVSPLPRIVGMNFNAQSQLYSGALVDTAATSETAALGARDYISWIRTATVDQLHLQSLPATLATMEQVLLYRFLRHGALAEYQWWGNQLIAQYAATPLPAWSEPELVAIIPGTETALTPWQRLGSSVTLPAIGPIDVSAFFDGDYESQLRALTGVGDFRDALAVLAPLPTAELERLFGEALDAVSHRLDAWLTSLATRRLLELRTTNQKQQGTLPCYVGAYGWVENLRPEQTTTATVSNTTVRTSPGGYVQGPSMAHAMTAAVLRNAYLTHIGETASPYAIDLSSAQVRMGRFVLDSVRDGQPVGAVFGYLVESGLQTAGAQSLIDPIRQIAPLVANQTSDDTTDPVDTIAARNVVDGLALRARWKAGTLFGAGGLSPTIAFRSVLETQLGLLDGDVDAVADLLLAESVHQVILGSTAASSAGLDALAQGVRPPDPAVAHGVTGGTTLTHRLAVVLGATPLVIDPHWPTTLTPRAACEPRLDAWIGSLLGNPNAVLCRVQYPDTSLPPAVQTKTVSFDQLGLRPLDVVAVATATTTNPAASELDRRVLYAAFGDSAPANAAAGATFTIVYAADPSWPRATTRTVPELIDLANTVARTLGGMRAFASTDVIVPSDASTSDDAQTQDPEATTRAEAAVTALTAAQTALQSAISSADPTQLRAALRQAALFGSMAGFPAFVAGGQEGGISPLPLVDQTSAALADLTARLVQAGTATDAATRAQAVFGRDFTLLVGFAFPTTSGAGGELAQALAYGPSMIASDAHAVDRWLTAATRVRTPLGRWRLLRVLAEASGAKPASWTLAQLPHSATASWVGLQPNAGETRSSGTLSLVLNAPGGAVDPTLPMYGLFLDDWVETIPNASEHTGIAFRYPDTTGEAPQTILVAVCPTTSSPTTAAPAMWDFESLLACITETLDNAKLRTLDLDSLDALAQLIPGIFLAANAGDDTISTSLLTRLDPIIAKEAL